MLFSKSDLDLAVHAPAVVVEQVLLTREVEVRMLVQLATVAELQVENLLVVFERREGDVVDGGGEVPAEAAAASETTGKNGKENQAAETTDEVGKGDA